MPREVRKFDDQAHWYVPNIEGNRNDPDPFSVLIRPITALEMRKIEQANLGKVNRVQEVNWIERSQEMLDSIIAHHVIQVHNYAAADVGTGERVVPKTGAELVATVKRASASEAAVLEDILEAIKDSGRLESGLLGKFVQPFASSSQATTPAAGDVPAADVMNWWPQTSTKPNGASYETATATPIPLTVVPGNQS